jgi:hypothetical protein
MRPLGIVWLLMAGCGAATSSSTSVEVSAVPERALAREAPPLPMSDAHVTEGALDCSLSWTPRRLGASVVAIPPETSARMMAPVLRALCACTKPGSKHSVVIDFEPGRGHATAQSGADDVALDRCLEPRLGDNVYPAFELGSDCIDCGPKRYGVFGGPAPEPPRGARMRMPFQVDRTSER